MVLTDIDGSSILEKILSNSILVFSGTNVENSESPLLGRKELAIVLKTRIGRLDEVQVIGYGTSTRRMATGNVSSVKAETIAEQPVSNPVAALEGRVAGLLIQQESGLPGSNFTVQIRGQNSISQGNFPLYVIDGVPFSAASAGSFGSLNQLLFNGISNQSP
jgi:hypothetical protein